VIKLFTNEIIRYTDEIFDKVKSLRREIHMYPELGFEEVKTASLVNEFLKELGLNIRTGLAKTGVIATLKGKEPGKTFAIRADMDALSISEENTFEYISKNSGKMHACGHDSHVAIVLGAAYVLTKLRDLFSGNVKFIFQPGEEGLGGAKLMVDEGALEDPKVDSIIAAHVSPLIETGSISVRSGPVMASPSEFDITIIGKSGHAAQPQKAINPIEIGARVVVRFGKVVKDESDPLKRAVLSVTQFNAGTAFNIIPDQVSICGTVRTFDDSICSEIASRMEEILKEETSKKGANYDFVFNRCYPPVINDKKLADFVCESAGSIISESLIIKDDEPSMLAEDFSYYAKAVPGAFFHLGCRKPGTAEINNLHSSRFNIDENCLKTGIQIMVQCCIDYLNS